MMSARIRRNQSFGLILYRLASNYTLNFCEVNHILKFVEENKSNNF